VATHRDGVGEPGASSYPGQAYPSPGYPNPTTWFSASDEADPPTEHRYAERIPRYPDGQQPPEAPAAGTPPKLDEDLRLVGSDLPPAPPPQPPVQQPVPPTPPASPPAVEQPAALADLLHDPTQPAQQVAPYPPAHPGTGNSHAHNQLAFGLAALALLFDVPVAVILVRSLTGSPLSVSGVVTGLLLLPGLPLLAAGLYQLFAGRIEVRPGEGLAALVRRPMAMLVIGIVLVVAGALAAS
jgi:hypothetical protein